jgi:hypothetical protein
MKKTIKLTEKDLTRLVKRVISEQPLEGELKYITLEIPESIIGKAIELGVSESNIEDMFEQYVKDSIGVTYNMELDYFTQWAEDSDNIADYEDTNI